MEVVGAVASVTGIVTLAGQALCGLITIKAFVDAIKDAPKGFATILGDIETLEGTLRAVSSFIEKTSAIPVVNLELSSMIGIVHSHLKSCCVEVSSWNAEIAKKQVDPPSGKKLMKRAAHVGHKDSLEKLAKRISRQQSVLSLDLSTLGRIYDGIAFEQRKKLETDIDVLSDRLSSIHSSISSIASTLSIQPSHKKRCVHSSAQTDLPPELSERLGSCLELLNTASTPAWSCDMITGIDDAFVWAPEVYYSECIFCGGKFPWDDAETFIRQGRHLVQQHSFGQCDFVANYINEDDFRQHLIQDHGVDPRRDIKKEHRFVLQRFQRYSDQPPRIPKSWRPQWNMISSGDDKQTSFHLILLQIQDMLNNCGVPLDCLLDGMNHGFVKESSHRLCSILSALDDEELSRRLTSSIGEEAYRHLCYGIGCRQEDLVVQGFEDILRFESICSTSQHGLRQIACVQTSRLDSLQSSPGFLWLPPETDGHFPLMMDCASRLYEAGLRPHINPISQSLSIELFRDASIRQRICELAFKPQKRKISVWALRDNLGNLEHISLGDLNERPEQKIHEWFLRFFATSISMRKILRGADLMPETLGTSPKYWLISTIRALLGLTSAGPAQVPTMHYPVSAATFSGHSYVSRAADLVQQYHCSRSNPITGEFCNKSYSRSLHLKYHKTMPHYWEKEMLICTSCAEENIFTDEAALFKHYRASHDPYSSNCNM